MREKLQRMCKTGWAGLELQRPPGRQVAVHPLAE